MYTFVDVDNNASPLKQNNVYCNTIIAFTLTYQTAYGAIMIMDLKGGVALGLLATGCAPGGGKSNLYSYLLGGDLSLSVTMTVISNIASLGKI